MDIFFTIVLTILVFFFGTVLTRLLQRHLHEAKLLRLREIVHIERMKALERDQPLPEEDAEALAGLLHHGPASGPTSDNARAAKERIIRLTALCLGLTSFLGGIGLTAGLHVQADPDVSGMWGIGLVPTLIGIGLMMFVRLSKGVEQSAIDDSGSE